MVLDNAGEVEAVLLDPLVLIFAECDRSTLHRTLWYASYALNSYALDRNQVERNSVRLYPFPTPSLGSGLEEGDLACKG